jgi:hypothetical protein
VYHSVGNTIAIVWIPASSPLVSHDGTIPDVPVNFRILQFARWEVWLDTSNLKARTHK